VQVRVQVADGGSPQRAAVAIVNVYVRQNLFNPIFRQQQSYARTIFDTQAAGVPILTISASDDDTSVCMLLITPLLSFALLCIQLKKTKTSSSSNFIRDKLTSSLPLSKGGNLTYTHNKHS